MRVMPWWATLALSLAVAPAKADGDARVLPDFLVLTIDTIRADHLGCYGYSRDTSPAIDALANESIVFERAISPISTTLPSHTSLLTSTYPEEHGILANVSAGGQRFVVNSALRTFAEVAREHGYRTGAVISAAPLKSETGISAGFDTFEQPAREVRSAEETTDRALEWLRRGVDGPLLLWVHYFDPHYPYVAPPGFRDRYESDEELEALVTPLNCDDVVLHRRREIDVCDANNRYDGAVRYLDGEIGRLLEAYRKLGRWNATVLVLVGDHGESLGEHGELAHGCIHGEQLWVPMMIRAPGLAPGRVADPVSLVDALPTALARVNVDLWKGFLEQSSGHDALARGFTPQAVLSQSTRRPGLAHPFAYALTTESWKLEHEPEGAERLYRVDSDRRELQDVARDHPEIVAEMREELLARVAAQTRRYSRRTGESEIPEKPMEPELLEQLRSLGYID